MYTGQRYVVSGAHFPTGFVSQGQPLYFQPGGQQYSTTNPAPPHVQYLPSSQLVVSGAALPQDDAQDLRKALDESQAQNQRRQAELEQALQAAQAELAQARRDAEAQARRDAEALLAAQAEAQEGAKGRDGDEARAREELTQVKAELARAQKELSQTQTQAQAAQAELAKISEYRTKLFVESIFNIDNRNRYKSLILEHQSESDTEEVYEDVQYSHQGSKSRADFRLIYSSESYRYADLLDREMFDVRWDYDGPDLLVHKTDCIRNLQQIHKINVDSYLNLLEIDHDVKDFLNKNSWIFTCKDDNINFEFMLALFKDNRELFISKSDSFTKLLSNASTSSKLFLREENFANFCFAVTVISETQERSETQVRIDDKCKTEVENIANFKNSLSEDHQQLESSQPASSHPASSQPEIYDPKLLIRAIDLYNLNQTHHKADLLDFSVQLSQDDINKLKICYYAEALFEKLCLTDQVDDNIVASYKDLYLRAVENYNVSGDKDDIKLIKNFFSVTSQISRDSQKDRQRPSTSVKQTLCERLMALSATRQDDGGVIVQGGLASL